MSRAFYGSDPSPAASLSSDALSLPGRPLPRRLQQRLAGGDRYVRVLAIILLGYAAIGRKVAIIGIEPVYNAEIMLAWGIWLLLEAGTLSLVLNSVPAMFLVLLMGWGLARTVPFFDKYRFDALRDAVLYGYGLFAFVIAGILLQSPERLVRLLKWYRKFVWLLFLIGLPMLLLMVFWFSVYNMPGGTVILFFLAGMKGGDLGVHVAGAFVYLTVLADLLHPPAPTHTGNRRPLNDMFIDWLPALLIVVALGLTMAVRAASMAFILAAAIAILVRPRSRTPWKLGTVIAASVILLAVSGVHIPLHNGRDLSFDQLSNNVQSIVGMGADQGEGLDGTKKWRLDWWNHIIDYTFHGQYFWTGKGFGVNLANDDGFQVNSDGSLRSPHNGHLTILARAGVPGLALWALVNLSWAIAMIDGFVRARRAKQEIWAGTFMFILAYWAAFLTNASFDVFLEAPVGGVWFWVIFGTGLAVQNLYRRSPELLATVPPPASGLPA